MSEGYHQHEGLVGATIFATITSVAALFMSVGPCARQEAYEGKIDHLERRIDNIQDGPRP